MICWVCHAWERGSSVYSMISFVSEGKIQSVVFLDTYFSFLFKVVTVHNLFFFRVTHLSVTLISSTNILSEEIWVSLQWRICYLFMKKSMSYILFKVTSDFSFHYFFPLKESLLVFLRLTSNSWAQLILLPQPSESLRLKACVTTSGSVIKSWIYLYDFQWSNFFCLHCLI